MIKFQQVSKHFGTQPVLVDVSLQINPGDRVGVVGPNGAGKSTVFSLIVGEMTPDRGSVEVPPNFRVGYVHQQLNPHAVDLALLPYTENALPEVQTIQAEIHALEASLHQPEPGQGDDGASDAVRSRAAMLRRLGELQTRFEHLGGYTLKNLAERTLSGLGFPAEWFEQPFRALSGGWQSRAELARALVTAPDALLLDEPSNYLDVPAIEWLQRYLLEYKGTLVLISHDRFLLNSLTTATIEVANNRAERYPGNYDYYARERTLRYDQRLAARKNQERKREQLERFIERFRAKNTKATQAQSRLKQLERMEEIEPLQDIVSRGRIRLRPPPHCGAEIVRLESAGLTYDGQRWVLQAVDLSVSRGDKIALVVQNGLGKTTLLRMLAGNLPLSAGKRVLGHKVVIGYQSQDFAETMDPRRTVFDTLKSGAGECSDQDIRTLLGSFGFSGDTVEKPVAVLSGGEKIRLAFARLLMNPPNFLVLDEPTTHLDIQARETLEDALRTYQGTLCLVSHDIDFVRHVCTEVIAMTPPGITRYAGGYDYYHEKVMGNQPSATGGKKGKAEGEPSSGRPDAEASTPDRKELRRQRALARQELHTKTKDLKKEIERVEKQIGIYEAEQATLVTQLSGDPAQVDFVALSKRLKMIQDEIVRYTERWERISVELEKVVSSEPEG